MPQKVRVGWDWTDFDQGQVVVLVAEVWIVIRMNDDLHWFGVDFFLRTIFEMVFDHAVRVVEDVVLAQSDIFAEMMKLLGSVRLMYNVLFIRSKD